MYMNETEAAEVLMTTKNREKKKLEAISMFTLHHLVSERRLVIIHHALL